MDGIVQALSEASGVVGKGLQCGGSEAHASPGLPGIDGKYHNQWGYPFLFGWNKPAQLRGGSLGRAIFIW